MATVWHEFEGGSQTATYARVTYSATTHLYTFTWQKACRPVGDIIRVKGSGQPCLFTLKFSDLPLNPVWQDWVDAGGPEGGILGVTSTLLNIYTPSYGSPAEVPAGSQSTIYMITSDNIGNVFWLGQQYATGYAPVSSSNMVFIST